MTPPFSRPLSRLASGVRARTAFPWLWVLASIVLGTGPLRAELKIGDPAPIWANHDLAAGTISPTAGKVVLLDFWASWCPPCKASFAAYARIYEELHDAGLLIVAVGVDDTLSAHASFLQKLKPAFSVVHDRTKSLVKEVKVKSMPTAYLIARDGKVRSIHVGFLGRETEKELREAIVALLAEKAPLP